MAYNTSFIEHQFTMSRDLSELFKIINIGHCQGHSGHKHFFFTLLKIIGPVVTAPATPTAFAINSIKGRTFPVMPRSRV